MDDSTKTTREPFSIGAIEKDAPIPRKGAGKRWYVLDTLQVGDSVAVTGVSVGHAQSVSSLNGKRLQKKFIARRVDDRVRIWRTK